MRARVVLGVAAVLAGLAVAGGVLVVSLPSLLVPLVGAVAVLVALKAAREWAAPADRPVVPTPERRHDAAVPGDAFDERLASASRHGPIGGLDDRDAVRDRLEAVTVDVLTRYDGDTPARARDRLATGTWTDDPMAAAFFGADVDASVTVLDRLRFAATSDSEFRRQAARVVVALDRRVAGGR